MMADIRSRNFNEEQTLSPSKQTEASTAEAEICSKRELYEATFHKWREKFSGKAAFDARQPRELDSESGKYQSWQGRT